MNIFLITATSVVCLLLEALMFRVFIKNISYAQSFLIALTGNMAAIILGWPFVFIIQFPVMGFKLPLYYLVTEEITTYIFIGLANSLIESLAIPIFFDYKIRQIIIPVFIGKFITYSILALIYGIS